MNADAVYMKIVVTALGAVYVLLVAAVFFIGRRAFALLDKLESQQNTNMIQIAVQKSEIESLKQQIKGLSCLFAVGVAVATLGL